MKTIKMLANNHYIDGSVIIREGTLVYVLGKDPESTDSVMVSITDPKSFIFDVQFSIPEGFLTSQYGAEKLKEGEYRLKDSTTINGAHFTKGRIFSTYKTVGEHTVLQLITTDGRATVSRVKITSDEIDELFEC